MAFSLSVHHLCALDISVDDLVQIAADQGCEYVGVFTYVPEAARGRYPQIVAADLPRLTEKMRGCGVRAGNLEVFPLDGHEDEEAFARSLDVGAALGATRATAHIHAVSNSLEAVERFGRFAALCAQSGIVAGLEFHRFSAVADIAGAAQIVREAGHEHGKLVCDALHLFRNGGSVEQAREYAPLIRYAQICDGPLTPPDENYWREAVSDRLIPGDGEFPLAALFAGFTPDTLVEVEVPQSRALKAGKSAAERIAAAVAGARKVLATC
jgi:sugar phosphate isomerase/epimerase